MPHDRGAGRLEVPELAGRRLSYLPGCPSPLGAPIVPAQPPTPARPGCADSRDQARATKHAERAPTPKPGDNASDHPGNSAHTRLVELQGSQPPRISAGKQPESLIDAPEQLRIQFYIVFAVCPIPRENTPKTRGFSPLIAPKSEYTTCQDPDRPKNTLPRRLRPRGRAPSTTS